MSDPNTPLPRPETPPPMPGWVKTFLIVLAVLVITFLIVHILFGGFGHFNHG
jgi:hypothetical protein